MSPVLQPPRGQLPPAFPLQTLPGPSGTYLRVPTSRACRWAALRTAPPATVQGQPSCPQSNLLASPLISPWAPAPFAGRLGGREMLPIHPGTHCFEAGSQGPSNQAQPPRVQNRTAQTSCCCLEAKSCQTLATTWAVAGRPLCPWDSPGKSTEWGATSPSGIFPTPGSEPTSPGLYR